MTDHDKLFKQLLTYFFTDFIKLFFPQAAEYLDEESIEFLDKEIFSDIAKGERYEADLVVKARHKSSHKFFLIHVEPQGRYESNFSDRMYRYFSRLYENHGLPVYPIALLSFDRLGEQPFLHEVEFDDLKVLRFQYRVVHLSGLDYKDYIKVRNPVAVALIGKMKVAREARAEVKLNCLRVLCRLDLDPARSYLISQFIDKYQKLTKAQEKEYQGRLALLPEKEEIMEYVTSWKREGIEEGREEGRRQEALKVVRLILEAKFGAAAEHIQSDIENFSTERLEKLAEKAAVSGVIDELKHWLESSNL